ncbi:YncE family protein [Gordonia sp. NPDC003376]
MHSGRSRSPRNPRARRACVALALLLTAALSAACGSGSDTGSTPNVATVSPASAVPAPAGPAAGPAGVIIPTAAGSSTMARSGDSLAVLGAAGTEVSRFDIAAITTPPTTIATPALTTLIGTGDGEFLGAGPGTLVHLAADGTVHSTPTEISDPTALARTADGRVLVGTGNGHVIVFDADLREQRDVGGFVRVDVITVSPAGADLDGEQVVVLDRAQSSVTPVDIDTGEFGAALRAGNGATTATVDHYGRIVVANTRDDEIIGFFGSPLVMRFRHPVADGPYAVDYDDTHNLLWVSTTGDNEVVAYDLAGGEPVEKHRFATVAQPDAIVVDDATGTVYVLSHRDGGLQVVAPPYGSGAVSTSPGSSVTPAAPTTSAEPTS